MEILNILFGVLMIATGIGAMFTPLATLFSTGIFIGILMFMYGVVGIIGAFRKKNDILQTIMSVLALIVGIISMVRPGSTLIIDGMILSMVAAFFLCRGITSVVLSIRTRKVNSLWILGLITGILDIILGAYSFAHPIFASVTTGILVGMYFVESGINMIVFATVVSADDDEQ